MYFITVSFQLRLALLKRKQYDIRVAIDRSNVNPEPARSMNVGQNFGCLGQDAFGRVVFDQDEDHDAEHYRGEKDGEDFCEDLENAKVAFPFLVFSLAQTVVGCIVGFQRLCFAVGRYEWLGRWVDWVKGRWIIVGIRCMGGL